MLLLGLTVLLAFVAYRITVQRDLGAGVLRPGLGPATAGPTLRGTFGLAWRFHRRSILSWSIGFGLLGLFFGLILNTLTSQLLSSPQIMLALSDIMGQGSPTDLFFSIFWAAFAIVGSVYGIGAILALRDEETSGRAEVLLAAPVGRLRWALSHISMALIGQAVIYLALGVLAGLGFELSQGGLSGSGLSRVLLLSISYLPAAWVMIGVATALVGFFPSLAIPFSWGWLAVVMIIAQGRELQFLPESVTVLSPYSTVPKVLLGEAATTPLLVSTAVAAALIAIGLFGLRRRDIG